MCGLLVLAESMTSQPHNFVLPCFWIVSVLCTIINFLLNQRAGYSGDTVSDTIYYLLMAATVVMEFYCAVSGVIGQDTAGYEIYKKTVLLGHVSNLFPDDGIVTEDEGYVLLLARATVLFYSVSWRVLLPLLFLPYPLPLPRARIQYSGTCSLVLSEPNGTGESCIPGWCEPSSGRWRGWSLG
jgi:hypothetical protein